MTMRWLHQWPTFWAGLLVVGIFAVVSLAGLWLTRPWVRKRCADSNELANYFFAAIGVFYALLVGLIAVSNWEDYSRVGDVVTGEAVAVSDLYRDMEAYPLPLREELRGSLRRYVEVVIQKEWPLQAQGKSPARVLDHVDQLVHRMVTFEPSTPGQQVAQGEILRQLNSVLTLRRQRLQAVDDGLSRLMWLIMLVGAAITIGITYLFCTEKLGIQAVLTVALSILIGLSVFLIFTLDGPLVGDNAIQPDSYQDALSTMSPGSLP
ncbi:MAG TPA: hypothetical protein VIA62_28975 [Thermoanaerobaculia bacterium]|jgi:hypothetical protein|nr:hypothetical protein [Thermoanaerobaculia bacterium]